MSRRYLENTSQALPQRNKFAETQQSCRHLVEYVRECGHDPASLPAELRYGAIKPHSAKLAERIDLIIPALEILPLETPADQ
jgi:hypothetical protein